jgi:hypothetical protein
MSDVFEKNIARLVKESALPLTDERRARARAEFLRATEAPASRSHLRLIGVAAAVLLFCGVIYETTTRPLPKLPPTPIPDAEWRKQNEPPAWTDVAGDPPSVLDVYQGSLRMSRPSRTQPFGRTLVFKGRSKKLPDGLCIRVLVFGMEEQLRGGSLVAMPKLLAKPMPVLDKGGFEFDLNLATPTQLVVNLEAPDSLQDKLVLEQTRTLEVERGGGFLYSPWDDSLLSRLGPQLRELGTVSQEARALVDRVEAACATEALFKGQEKKLIAEAERLQARAEGLANNGLYPAASWLQYYTLRDLATSMAIFKWKDGKLEGPVSYYTNGKPGNTFRGDPFGFETLRKYLTESVLVSGREFDLWILRDYRRAGPRAELAVCLLFSEEHPGVAEFAAALKEAVEAKVSPTAKLEAEIRKISK